MLVHKRVCRVGSRYKYLCHDVHSEYFVFTDQLLLLFFIFDFSYKADFDEFEDVAFPTKTYNTEWVQVFWATRPIGRADTRSTIRDQDAMQYTPVSRVVMIKSGRRIDGEYYYIAFRRYTVRHAVGDAATQVMAVRTTGALFAARESGNPSSTRFTRDPIVVGMGHIQVIVFTDVCGSAAVTTTTTTSWRPLGLNLILILKVVDGKYWKLHSFFLSIENTW